MRVGNESSTSAVDASSKNERCIRRNEVFSVNDYTTFECPYPGIVGNIVTVQGSIPMSGIEVQLQGEPHTIQFVFHLKFVSSRLSKWLCTLMESMFSSHDSRCLVQSVHKMFMVKRCHSQ